MALLPRRTLELAGISSKVQLQRLHLVKNRKQRHLVRNAVLAGGVIAAGTVAAAAVAFRKRGCGHAPGAGNGEREGSAAESTPDTEPDREGAPKTKTRGPHKIWATEPV